MPITRAELLKELLPGLEALFGVEYEQYVEPHEIEVDLPKENEEKQGDSRVPSV